MLKILAKIFIGFLTLSLLVGGILYVQDRHFWHRYYMLKTSGGILPQEGWEGSEYVVDGGEHQLLELVDEKQRTISPEALKAVSEYAAERKTSALLIWHKGQLQFRQHYQGMDENSLIIGKSMAKMVASVVVARAIKDGYIASLDEPAATYITEWQDSGKAAISIRHLLHMAAGFEDYYTLDMGPFSNFLRTYIGGHTEDVLIHGYELVDEPGTRYDYSQAVSDLLALILERATGMPYGQFLSESLIQPLQAQGGEVMMNRPNGLAHSGCCLLLPSESWLRIGILLLKGGQHKNMDLFPNDWMQAYLEPSPANPAMGLHIWLGKPYLPKRSWTEVGAPERYGTIHSEPYLADDLFLFDGSGNQVMYIIPSLELVILRTGSFNWEPGKEWDNSYLPNTIIRGIIKE